MFAVCVITLLSLATVSHSAPLPCEELVQPLDQLHLHHLEGRRALIAASLSDPSHLEKFKSRDSAGINFANDTSQISFTGAYGFRDSCQYLHTNVTLEGSSFTFGHMNITVTFLHTSCQDCVVMRFDNKLKELQRLYLFSKRREVGQEEISFFFKQSLGTAGLQQIGSVRI